MPTGSNLDLIFLIHNATLELYGIPRDPQKSLKLAGLLTEVAEGKRTFIESDNERVTQELREEAEAEGVDLDERMHEQRLAERNIACWLKGLPPLD